MVSPLSLVSEPRNQETGKSAPPPMDCENGAGGEDRSKFSEFKEEIVQLAALACHEGQEETRTDLLDKFNKCTKDTLVELLRSFDMTGSKANRKEELVTKLMEFLKLHCFGTDGTNPDKINDFKEQMLQLARLAFHEEEEKSWRELLEKLSKCNKDTLVELCRSFDIPGSKANKKEELVTVVMEFLKEYCSDTDATNIDKKTKKRRRKSEGSNLSGGRPLKKKKSDGTAPETHGEDEGDEAKCEDDRTKYSECNFEGSENECANDEKGQVSNEEACPEPSERTNGHMSENFDGVALTEVQILTDEQALARTPYGRVVSTVERERIDMKTSRKKNDAIAKKNTIPKTNRKEKSCKQMSRGDAKPRNLAARPSRDELRQAVFCILDTADFATMTFGEVVKEVDKYFGKDLFEKKPLIRSLIEEELFRLAEEAEKKELEEEEAAEAKARAEVATKGMTQDGVNSGIDKAEELQVDKDVKSEDAAKIEDGNRVEQVLKAWISVDDESRNRIDAAESSQDGQCEHDRRNENNGGDFTSDDNAQDINRGDHVECSRDCDRLKKNNNSEAMGGSEDGKSDEANTGENDVTKDGINRNGGKSALDDVCGAEPTLDGENGENATCLEEGKAEETGNVENSENTASHDAKDGKGKEAMENANTEQSITGANDDGKTEYAEHTVNTKADVDLPADGATENGKTEDQIATSKQSEMAQLTDMHAAHAGN